MGQLHTYAKEYVLGNNGYADANILETFRTAMLHQKVDAFGKSIGIRKLSVEVLESREKEFYKWFNANDYDSFMVEVRKALSKAKQDREVFSRFKKTQLDIRFGITDVALSKVKGQKIEIIFTKPPSIEIAQILSGIPNLHYSGKGNGSINFEYNPNNIKNFLNAYEQRLNTRYELDPKANDLTATKKALRIAVEQNSYNIFLISDTPGKQIKEDITSSFSRDKKSNFSLTKIDIEKALGLRKASYKELASLPTREEIVQARQGAYNQLRLMCSGGSDILIEAFEKVWRNKIGFGESNKELAKFGFLSLGKSTDKLKGSVQELASAMLLEYIAITIKKQHYNEIVANVLGDIVGENGESPKKDIDFLKRIGIQIKAYQEPMTDNYPWMGTNIHPRELDAGLLPFNTPQNLGDYIVQAHFNATNPWSDDTFENIVKEGIVQVMSLTGSEGITDTVCFYLVDLQYLIPGSEILKHFEEEPNQMNIELRANTVDLFIDDEMYHHWKNFPRKDGSMGPAFLWYYNQEKGTSGKNKQFNATDLNKSMYTEMYTKNISIDINFNHKFMYSSKYALY